MTKTKVVCILLFIAFVSYIGLFFVERWQADAAGVVTGIDVVEGIVRVQVDQPGTNPMSPGGRVILLLTPRSSLVAENMWRSRKPVPVQALRLGQKVLAQYSFDIILPTFPPERSVSELMIAAW